MRNKKDIGRSLDSIRLHNCRVIVKNLFNRPYSPTELSDIIKLSHTSIRKIYQQLMSYDLVKVHDESSKPKQRGSQHIRHKLNENKGIIICIDFTLQKDRYWFLDTSCKVMYQGKFRAENIIKMEDLNSMVQKIKSDMEEIGKGNLPIIAVVATIPGQISKKTGKFLVSSRFDRYLSDINIIEWLKEQFKTEQVVVKNDTHVAAICEKHFNHHPNSTVLYVNVGVGISCAIYDEQIYSGYEGFFGEMGINYVDEDHNLHMVASTEYLLFECEPYLEEKTFDALLRAYENDSRVRKIILNSAQVLGIHIRNITNVHACNVICLTGEIANFGEAYLHTIVEVLKDNMKAYPIKVYFSEEKDPVKIGLFILAEEEMLNYVYKVIADENNEVS